MLFNLFLELEHQRACGQRVWMIRCLDIIFHLFYFLLHEITSFHQLCISVFHISCSFHHSFRFDVFLMAKFLEAGLLLLALDETTSHILHFARQFLKYVCILLEWCYILNLEQNKLCILLIWLHFYFNFCWIWELLMKMSWASALMRADPRTLSH